jgi:DNA-binding Lrp family transcriptional regulator
MRKIREVLRLKFEAKLSHEKIAASTGMSKGAVSNYVRRAVEKEISWPLPADLDESRLEMLLFKQGAPRERYAQPDYALYVEPTAMLVLQLGAFLGMAKEWRPGEFTDLSIKLLRR